jgi:hypothetical protein
VRKRLAARLGERVPGDQILERRGCANDHRRKESQRSPLTLELCRE